MPPLNLRNKVVLQLVGRTQRGREGDSKEGDERRKFKAYGLLAIPIILYVRNQNSSLSNSVDKI